jgi:hypothetical protein
MAFSPQQALNLTRTLALPRRVGSEGEQFVAEEITRLLEGFGYHVEHHPFLFISALHGWIKLEVAIGSLLILAILMLRTASPWAPILPVILLLSLIFLANSLHRWVQASSLLQVDRPTVPLRIRFLSWLGPRFKSTNIIASPPDRSHDDDTPHLTLMAHYDSKSQTLPLPIRMALFVLYILGGISISSLTILSIFFPDFKTIIPYFAWGSLLFGIPLLYMDVGNDSPGAIDNASGVGLLLHLAELMAGEKDLLQKLQVTFLFTGAEEEGLMGVQAYVKEKAAVLQQQDQRGGLYILNLDGVGTQGKLLVADAPRSLVKTHGESLGDWIHEICSELDYPLGRFPPIGALMDHVPFAHYGFKAISLATGGKAASTIHTPHDTADKLHPEGFEQAGRVILKLIERLAAKESTPGPKAHRNSQPQKEDSWFKPNKASR